MRRQTSEQPDGVQALLDRAEITDLVSRLDVCSDEGRFDELAGVLTEDAVGLVRDGEVGLAGREAMQETARANLSRFDGVQHVVTNILVDLSGDTAKVRANLVATHVYDADDLSAVWTLKGVYRLRARRTPDGWRLSHVALHRLWDHDTSHSPAGL